MINIESPLSKILKRSYLIDSVMIELSLITETFSQKTQGDIDVRLLFGLAAIGHLTIMPVAIPIALVIDSAQLVYCGGEKVKNLITSSVITSSDHSDHQHSR